MSVKRFGRGNLSRQLAVNPSLGARWRHPCRQRLAQKAISPSLTDGHCSQEGLFFSAVPSRLALALVAPLAMATPPLPLARGRNPATPARFLWRFSCRCKRGGGSPQAAPAVAACVIFGSLARSLQYLADDCSSVHIRGDFHAANIAELHHRWCRLSECDR